MCLYVSQFDLFTDVAHEVAHFYGIGDWGQQIFFSGKDFQEVMHSVFFIYVMYILKGYISNLILIICLRGKFSFKESLTTT